MIERYFYHNFPRLRRTGPPALDKGCSILSAIRDSGLLLMPEYIEFKQPTISGEPRILPIFQSRICFTELSPVELPEHAEKFGPFALEFEVPVLRRLGAMPVFYLPDPLAGGENMNALGMALLAVTMDAKAIVERMAFLDNLFKGSMLVEPKLGFNPGFARNPDALGKFTIDTEETKNFLNAVGYMTTPLGPLNIGMNALLNFFYPADDIRHDRLLEYYRQREWRIACNFAINGVEIMRPPTLEEKARFLAIDTDFFGGQIKTDLGTHGVLDNALVHPGMDGKSLIEMVRRVIVPGEALIQAKEILSVIPNSPALVAIEDLPNESNSAFT